MSRQRALHVLLCSSAAQEVEVGGQQQGILNKEEKDNSYEDVADYFAIFHALHLYPTIAVSCLKML